MQYHHIIIIYAITDVNKNANVQSQYCSKTGHSPMYNLQSFYNWYITTPDFVADKANTSFTMFYISLAIIHQHCKQKGDSSIVDIFVTTCYWEEISSSRKQKRENGLQNNFYA